MGSRSDNRATQDEIARPRRGVVTSTRMNIPFLFVALSVAAVGAGIAVFATRKPWLRPEDRLWVIGDSLGVGLIPFMKSHGDNDNISVSGFAIGGTNIMQWSQKITPQAIQDANATAVLIILGSNDAAASEDYVFKKAPHYAHELVRSLQSQGIKVWWLAPGQTGALKYSEQIRSMLAGLSFSEGIEEHEPPDSIEYSPLDGVHPTPKGYKDLADWIWQRMTRA